MRIAIVTVLFILSLFGAGAGSSAERLEVTGVQRLDGADYHRISANNYDQDYHVLVGLPADYDGEPEATYPTVYLLDGGTNFPLLVAYQHMLRLNERVPQAILVGISYGADRFEDGNFRGRDYTAPSRQAAHYGGAGNFQAFLRNKLMPIIESEYRSDPARRIIFGQSLGGQFVLYTAQTEPGLFWGHIATNPALHRNLPFFLEQHGEDSSRSKLFVASATNESRDFKPYALRWIDHWTSMESTPWDLEVVFLEGHTHLSANPEAYRQGMIWLFD